MSDSIELLENIGSDASLRHASSDELLALLQRAAASMALQAAVANGDSSRLTAEFGIMQNLPPQISNAPGHEEEEAPEPEEEEQPAASARSRHAA